jgi:hypothetical protein
VSISQLQVAQPQAPQEQPQAQHQAPVDQVSLLVAAVLTDWLPNPTDARLVVSAADTFGSDWRYLLDMVQAANRCKPKPAT